MSDGSESKEEQILKNIDRNDVPSHIAIILDGNGRWAKRNDLPRAEGHRRGSENITNILEAAEKAGVKYLTVYAFSTENWSRPEEEVEAIMFLFEDILERKTPELVQKNVRLNVIGDLMALPESTRKKFEWSMNETKAGEKITLNVAVNYSGRDEISRAYRKTCKNNDVNIEDHLDTAGMPDPELLIRTSGELRISNFMLWQLAYTELYFTNVLWPDFKPQNLYEAIIDYQGRERRFGGLEKI